VTAFIYVPQDRIVYLSELFFAEQFLYIDDGLRFSNWLKTLEAGRGAGGGNFRAGRMVPHSPKTPGRTANKGSTASGRCWWISVMRFRKRVARGATEDQAIATIRWPQYEKNARIQRPKGKWRCGGLYRQLTGTLP